MTITLRVILIVFSVITSAYTIQKIRKSKVDIGDTVFWILFSFYLLLISIFPNIMVFLARLCGIQTPVNMVFLSVIALLGYKCFTLSLKISAMEMKFKLKVIRDSSKEGLSE
ncbi:hypothetical protein SDC9_97613 [bioreactor metagenome]|uniref:DUF2304 domain-containing protein n=1 Tax=bioreactor metagenome TaxID=1076179 RepID=A0A645ACW7_9ZZZZ